jgi:hypothetical protein
MKMNGNDFIGRLNVKMLPKREKYEKKMRRNFAKTDR